MLLPTEERLCPLCRGNWHGLPRRTCPSIYGTPPGYGCPERTPCARCATGFPIPHKHPAGAS